jgi:hypothetical protein
MSSECEVFKAAYLDACAKLEATPIKLLVEILDDNTASGNPRLDEIALRGNAREMFKRRVLDIDLEAILMALAACPDAMCNTLELSWNDITDAVMASWRALRKWGRQSEREREGKRGRMAVRERERKRKRKRVKESNRESERRESGRESPTT